MSLSLVIVTGKANAQSMSVTKLILATSDVVAAGYTRASVFVLEAV